MATGNIRRTGGKRNYAKVTPPTTSSATTAADTTNVTITYTASTLGPAATSYLVTATSTTAATVTTTLTTSPTTVSMQSGATYSANIVGQNYNGPSQSLSLGNFTIPSIYVLQSTYNTNGTYTVPSGVNQIAAYVIAAGGGGGGGASASPNARFGAGGGGGGSGAIVGFKDFTVTAGQTVTITIGTAGTAGNGSPDSFQGANSGGTGGLSKITYGGTDIATANGGVGGSAASPANNGADGVAGAGGSGGTGSSNVAGAITITGRTGGVGRNRDTAAGDGTVQSSNSNLSGALINAILPSNIAYGSAGGGGIWNSTGGTGAGGGGSGTTGTGNAGTAEAAGGGGGAGSTSGYTASSPGAVGFRGQVILYTK